MKYIEFSLCFYSCADQPPTKMLVRVKDIVALQNRGKMKVKNIEVYVTTIFLSNNSSYEVMGNFHDLVRKLHGKKTITVFS